MTLMTPMATMEMMTSVMLFETTMMIILMKRVSSRGAARRSCKVKTIRVDNANGHDGDDDIDDVVEEGEQQGSR